MKNQVMLLGALLLIGVFLISPISAATQIDKGGYSIYSEEFGDGYFKWQTFKYNNNYVKVFGNVVYPDADVKGSIVFILNKYSSTRLKISMGSHADWGNYASNYTFKTKYNAVQYYNGNFKYSVRSFNLY